MYDNLKIHERLNAVLNVLNRMTVTGFDQASAVVTVMREIAAIDQEMLKAEQDEKEQTDNNEKG